MSADLDTNVELAAVTEDGTRFDFPVALDGPFLYFIRTMQELHEHKRPLAQEAGLELLIRQSELC